MTIWIAVFSGVAGLITAVGAIFAVVLDRRNNRNKPVLDKDTSDKYRAEIKRMTDESNTYRDIRLGQLEDYVDLDREWHRGVITEFRLLLELLRQLRAEGLIPAETTIPDEPPPPPPLPKPPPRG